MRSGEGMGSVGMLQVSFRISCAPCNVDCPGRGREGELNLLFSFSEQTEDHASFPDDPLVVCSSRELLTDIAPFPVVDAVHKVDVGFEWQSRKVCGAFGHGVDQPVKVIVFWCDLVEEFARRYRRVARRRSFATVSPASRNRPAG